MPTIPDGADSWLVVLFVVAYVVVELRKSRAGRRRSESVEVVREHVANTHETNLRSDVDRVLGSQTRIEHVLAKIDARTERIGTEVRVLKEEHDKTRRELFREIARNDRIIAKHHPDESS